MSDFKHHRLNQHYLQETRAQAQGDRLVRDARPGFRHHLAALLTGWAARLEGRFDCTPLQGVPVAEGTSLTGLATPLFAHGGAALRCEVSPRARFSCAPYPARSVGQAGPGL